MRNQRIFAIGDPHLSNTPGKSKPMHIFGEDWRDHDKQIANNWNAIGKEDDLLLIVGDISWALKLKDALYDLEWIDKELVGFKILLQGNHDFWWPSKNKFTEIIKDYPSIRFLDSSYIIEKGVAIVGSRGWQSPGDFPSKDVFKELPNNKEFKESFTENDLRIYTKEATNLRKTFEALKNGGEIYNTLIYAQHYPAFNPAHEPSMFTDLIKDFNVDIFVNGHQHGVAAKYGFTGKKDGCQYHLVACDHINFTPKRIF